MATYKLPPGYVVVRPNQQTNKLDFANPEGVLADEPGNPPAPELVSPIPDLSGRVGQSFSYDASQHFSAPGPLTFTATGLPPPLTISSAGLISGTPSSADTFFCSVVAEDGYDRTVSSSFSFLVQPEITVVDRTWNGPNGRGIQNTSNIRASIWFDPLAPDTPVGGRWGYATGTQMLMNARAAKGGMHQELFVQTSADREKTKRLTQWLVDNKLPGSFFMHHGNYTEFPTPELSSNNFFNAFRDWAVGTEDRVRDCALINNSNEIMGQKTPASAYNRSLAYSYGKTANQAFIDRTVSNLYQLGDEYLADLWPAIFSDAIPITSSNMKFAGPDFTGSVTAKSGLVVTVNGSWSPPNDGTPDPNDGSFTLIASSSPKWGLFHPTAWGRAESVKNIVSFRDNGSTMSFRLSEDVFDWVGVGTVFDAYDVDGYSNSAKWPDMATDGETFLSSSVGFSNLGDHFDRLNGVAARCAGVRQIFDIQDDYIFGKTGKHIGGILGNTVSTSQLNKWNSGYPKDHGFVNSCVMTHIESAQAGTSSSRGFRQDDNDFQYSILTVTDIRFYIEKLTFGVSHLKRVGYDGDFAPRPFAMFTIDAGDTYHLDENNFEIVIPADQTACAFIAFYETFVMMGGGGDWCFTCAIESNALNYATGLMIVSIGDAPVTPATAFDVTPVEDNTADWVADPTDHYAMRWGLHTSYDPEANSFKGLATIRPSDWGSGEDYQWEKWWPCQWIDADGNLTSRIIVTVLNMRAVSSRILDWNIDNNDGADQTKDTYTLHDIPAGYRARALDLTSYINPENGEQLGTGIWNEINGWPTDIRWEQDYYPYVDNGRPGEGAPIDSGVNGGTIVIPPGRARWYVIGPE